MLRQLLYTGECGALSGGQGFFQIRSVIRAEYRGNIAINIAGGRNGGEVINVDDSDSDRDGEEARANGRVVAEDASSEDGRHDGEDQQPHHRLAEDVGVQPPPEDQPPQQALEPVIVIVQRRPSPSPEPRPEPQQPEARPEADPEPEQPLRRQDFAVGREFQDFDVFKRDFYRFCEQRHNLVRIVRSERYPAREGRRIKRAHIGCVHYGQPVQLRGRRQRQRDVLPCGCEFSIKIAHNRTSGRYVVKHVNLDHSNHDDTPEHWQSLPQARRLTAEQRAIYLALADAVNRGEAPVDAVGVVVRDEAGINLRQRDVWNLRAAARRMQQQWW